ncbi:hypothetical protein [Xylophilus sp.]|uniref:hypothetical protein n=1 Tax=Xylophilus sp. TaxID=2653893 RepID=UPI0013BCECDF|nr:hypothetical protein [Xylophilus sp.]KAF1049834.1 MAG: hypothetical protein GAK38_00497 [Xylophilus sp.]
MAMRPAAHARLAQRRRLADDARRAVARSTHPKPEDDQDDNERSTPVKAPPREPAIPVKEPVEPDKGAARRRPPADGSRRSDRRHEESRT